ncbi:MAG: hypothetical protein ABJO86_05080 [Lentilitoribacter sp.]
MSKKSNKRASQKGADNKTRQNVENPARRKWLDYARNGAITLAVLGSGGGYLAYSANAKMHEQDLTRIGQGTPTVVQVHDPNCSVCARLQRNTKSALGAFSEGDIEYVVANIKSSKGKAFAERNAVPHITLMLYDGKGELKHILRGPQEVSTLEVEFKKLLEG